MLWWQSVKYTVEDELSQKEFVPSADLASDSTFRVDDV